MSIRETKIWPVASGIIVVGLSEEGGGSSYISLLKSFKG